MLTKTINYVDYDGNERSEKFYFNLTEAELVEMEVSATGGLTRYIEKILEGKDGAKIMGVFKELLFKSYGEKSPDGRRFIKSPELSEAFSQTEAYNKLFMELCTDEKAAAAFVNGIIPAGAKVNKPESLPGA